MKLKNLRLKNLCEIVAQLLFNCFQRRLLRGVESKLRTFYKTKPGQSSKSESDAEKAFRENAATIAKHNQDKNSTYKQGTNNAADMTQEEKDARKGYKSSGPKRQLPGRPGLAGLRRLWQLRQLRKLKPQRQMQKPLSRAKRLKLPNFRTNSEGPARTCKSYL